MGDIREFGEYISSALRTSLRETAWMLSLPLAVAWQPCFRNWMAPCRGGSSDLAVIQLADSKGDQKRAPGSTSPWSEKRPSDLRSPCSPLLVHQEAPQPGARPHSWSSGPECRPEMTLGRQMSAVAGLSKLYSEDLSHI